MARSVSPHRARRRRGRSRRLRPHRVVERSLRRFDDATDAQHQAQQERRDGARQRLPDAPQLLQAGVQEDEEVLQGKGCSDHSRLGSQR